jgi:ATP-dependent DNA helicase RecG
MIEIVNRILKKREGIRLEFKEAKTDLPSNLFESICSMLNRNGGNILLGVKNNGQVIGIDPIKVEILKTNIVTMSNNSQKLDPPFILFPQSHILKGKVILHIQIPESSQVHKTNGIVYDRSNDGDFKVTQLHRIAEMYNRKRTHYTEGTIYPKVKLSDFNSKLFPKIRNLIRSNNSNHPWLALNNKQMLEKSGLWKRDFQSGQKGYTLAAVLIFGKDEIIQQILPHHKIDAIVRKLNIGRYDDREYIQTNLIDSYDKLMGFIAKHLPDKFYIQGGQRKSLRTAIFREIVANLIVHREYTNAHPCTFTITKNKVETENANNPHGSGLISPANFTPFPKNPVIAKFFIQLGLVEELGSGILNVNRFLTDYTPGTKPSFIEGDTFKIIVPIPEDYTTLINESVIEPLFKGASKGISAPTKDRLLHIIKLIITQPGLKIADLIKEIDISERVLRGNIEILIKYKFIIYKGSKKTGGYFLAPIFSKKLEIKEIKYAALK